MCTSGYLEVGLGTDFECDSRVLVVDKDGHASRVVRALVGPVGVQRRVHGRVILDTWNSG